MFLTYSLDSSYFTREVLYSCVDKSSRLLKQLLNDVGCGGSRVGKPTRADYLESRMGKPCFTAGCIISRRNEINPYPRAPGVFSDSNPRVPGERQAVCARGIRGDFSETPSVTPVEPTYEADTRSRVTYRFHVPDYESCPMELPSFPRQKQTN